MPIFSITTRELFETVAQYTVEAATEDEAVRKVIEGNEAYDYHEHPGNDDQFLEVTEVKELDMNDYFRVFP